MTNDVASDPPSVMVKEDVFSDISACWECSVKHLTCARVEYFEYLQNNESIRDLMWCIGDLACAEKHLFSLDRDLAEAVRYLRRRIMANDIELGEFDQLVVMVCSFAGLFKEREIKDKQ